MTKILLTAKGLRFVEWVFRLGSYGGEAIRRWQPGVCMKGSFW